MRGQAIGRGGGGLRYILPAPVPQPLSTASSPNRWTSSTIFGLFLLLVGIATVNVFIVSFVWESFAAVLENEQQQAKIVALQGNSPGGPQQIGGSASFKSVALMPRKVSAQDWTRTSLRCRYEDCVRARDSALAVPGGSVWSQQDFKACASALFSPRDRTSGGEKNGSSPTSHDIIPLDSPCVKKEETLIDTAEDTGRSSCKREKWHTQNLIVVYVERGQPAKRGEESFFEDAISIIKQDETFSVGLSANFVFTGNKYADWDVRLRSVLDANAARLHVESEKIVEHNRCKKLRTTISVNANAKAHPNALYGALRDALVQTIQGIRPEANVRLAVLLIWAGTKPPPSGLLEVAKSFVRADPSKVTCLVMIEDAFAKGFRSVFDSDNDLSSGKYKDRIRLIHQYDEFSKGNLTNFIHSRADVLVPSIRGHHQYALGWSLCDFRWLFGAIFEKFLPESEFTHWAWGDSDAFVGRLFGPVTDYGYDFARHDVTSFAAVVLEKNAPASSMMAYSSGTFTVIRNTQKGRNLFRFTPKEKLDRALTRPSNGILDEVGTSNAVFSAQNVSIALIGSQARVAGTVFDRESGKLYFVAENARDSQELEKLQSLARANEPNALAPMGFATVLARFAGGDSLPGQIRYVHPDDKVRWYRPPHVNPDHFLNLLAPGSGFAALLRDEQGYWWNRPLPFQFASRSRDRAMGAFEESRPIVRVEMAIVHSRLGGPCVIGSSKDVYSFDWTLASAGNVERPKSVDFNSKQCSPFKKFFKTHH